jgi:hypothetical protein
MIVLAMSIYKNDVAVRSAVVREHEERNTLPFNE